MLWSEQLGEEWEEKESRIGERWDWRERVRVSWLGG